MMAEEEGAIQTAKVLIVGSGFSGLGLAVRLKQSGLQDFVILERASEVGGTWRDNTYPGCACDVQSQLYSFSFAPNPNWSTNFSPQPEILDYLKACVRNFELGPHLHFDTAVQGARWDESDKVWHVETNRGAWRAQVLIAAAGPLSDPNIPELKGFEEFQGPVFHSSRWNSEFDYNEKRVAVVGTGASAVQFIPVLQKSVSKLVVYQRTPAWVVPRPNRKISETEKRIFRRFPRLLKFLRDSIFWSREAFIGGFRHPRILILLEAYVKWNLAQVVRDKTLRRKLTPKYRIGCKRILMSSEYWPALASENVEVIDHAVEGLTTNGVLANGSLREVDAVIFATGFRVTDSPFYSKILNSQGVPLSQNWNGSPKAYFGLATAGFPNLFFLLGPNSGLGHNSVVEMIEAQIEYLLPLLRKLNDGVVSKIAVKPEAEEKFISLVERDMQQTVWLKGGCSSWYLDKTGRNSTLWPRSIIAYRSLLKAGDSSAYEISP